jgi:hypothetical protein
MRVVDTLVNVFQRLCNLRANLVGCRVPDLDMTISSDAAVLQHGVVASAEREQGLVDASREVSCGLEMPGPEVPLSLKVPLEPLAENRARRTTDKGDQDSGRRDVHLLGASLVVNRLMFGRPTVAVQLERARRIDSGTHPPSVGCARPRPTRSPRSGS